MKEGRAAQHCCSTMRRWIYRNYYGKPTGPGCISKLRVLSHARRDLPRYAVPVFLRIVKEPSMNNTHKQSKTKLREDGVHPNKTGEDLVYVLQRDNYVKFNRARWNALSMGRSRL